MTGTPLTDVKVGGRRLRPGDVVKAQRLRGTYRITELRAFDDRPVEVTLVGGPGGHYRVVTIDRVGVRKATAAGAQVKGLVR